MNRIFDNTADAVAWLYLQGYRQDDSGAWHLGDLVAEIKLSPANDGVTAVNVRHNGAARPRSLSTIAAEIRRDWRNPYFGAVPYLAAMAQLDSIGDNYGADSAQSVVLYFLSNASSWRGETARRVKAELSAMARKPNQARR